MVANHQKFNADNTLLSLNSFLRSFCIIYKIHPKAFKGTAKPLLLLEVNGGEVKSTLKQYVLHSSGTQILQLYVKNLAQHFHSHARYSYQ